MLITQLAEEFYAYMCNEKGASLATISAYSYDLKILLRFLESEGIPPTIDSIQPPVIRRYLAFMNARGYKSASVRRRIHSLKSMWNYFVDAEYLERSPFKRIGVPKKEKTVPISLSPDELEALIEVAEHSKYADLAYRDRAIMSVLIHTGLRRQELLDLKIYDIDLEMSILRVEKGKGSKTRLIPLNARVYEALEDWLILRPQCEHDYLFTSRQNGRLDRNGLYRVFNRCFSQAGIQRKGVTLHKLRSSFATMLLNGGCSLVVIQRLLGHQDISTTAAAYLSTDVSALREAVDLHPLISRSSDRLP